MPAIECASANKKRMKKFLRNQENGVRRVIFVLKMLFFIQ
jgi:hypothetical protein